MSCNIWVEIVLKLCRLKKKCCNIHCDAIFANIKDTHVNLLFTITMEIKGLKTKRAWRKNHQVSFSKIKAVLEFRFQKELVTVMICGRKRGLRWCKLSGQESRWSGRLSIIASQFMTCSMVLSFTISQSSLLFPFSSLPCSVYSSLDGTLHCGLNIYWLVQKRSTNHFIYFFFKT